MAKRTAPTTLSALNRRYLYLLEEIRAEKAMLRYPALLLEELTETRNQIVLIQNSRLYPQRKEVIG